MRVFVRKLVERLADRTAPLSRNRHHALLSSPEGLRARRLAARLRGLEDDFAKYGDDVALHVEDDAGGLQIRLEIRSIKLVRESRLSADDVAILERHGGPLVDAIRRARGAA